MTRAHPENDNKVEAWDDIYSTPAKATQWTQWGAEDLVDKVAQWIPLHCHVLDVGTGAGIGPECIARRRKDILWTGADFSPNAIEYLKTYSSVPWKALVHADLREQLPFPSRSFEVVMCTELLEHLEDPQKAYLELVRVARSRVIVTVPRENVVDSHFHLWSITTQDLDEWMRPHGSAYCGLARSNRQIIGVLCKSS